MADAIPEAARSVPRHVAGTAGPLCRLRAALKRLHRRRATIEELRRLDDRVLADIGLTRDGIAKAVDGLIAGKPVANENEPPLAA